MLARRPGRLEEIARLHAQRFVFLALELFVGAKEAFVEVDARAQAQRLVPVVVRERQLFRRGLQVAEASATFESVTTGPGVTWVAEAATAANTTASIHGSRRRVIASLRRRRVRHHDLQLVVDELRARDHDEEGVLGGGTVEAVDFEEAAAGGLRRHAGGSS